LFVKYESLVKGVNETDNDPEKHEGVTGMRRCCTLQHELEMREITGGYN
jgi:hypothetical protein